MPLIFMGFILRNICSGTYYIVLGLIVFTIGAASASERFKNWVDYEIKQLQLYNYLQDTY